MTDNKIRAIALCRVSTKGQMLDGNLDPQHERIVKAADILNVEIVRWWELAVSSRKGKNVKRKDLMEMLDYCKHHRSIKYLIVDEVDRFMRSINEYYWWKMEFKNIGVQLRHANRPEVNPEDDRSVFDELIDVYRAESSNNERIHKTPDKMMAKIRAGYYPSNPHTGYKKSDVPGFHVPDEPNWSALRDTFKEMVKGELTVSEGLKKVTERGLRTKNYGPKAVGGKTIDMFRWKNLMKESYYCGVVRMADWPEINQNGLHQKMISPQEHRVLVSLADNKGKKFTVNRENPLFPLSNEMECFGCLEKQLKYPRLVGYPHNNGIKRKHSKVYNRYRCRECNLNILQQELHDELSNVLASLVLTEEQVQKLKLSIKRAWQSYEKTLIERLAIAEGHVENLKSKKSELVMSLSRNPDLEQDIKAEITVIKERIEEAEVLAINARDFERDLIDFTNFALDYVNDWKNNWWSLDKETMRKCKQILFPAGFSMTQDKKIYTPEISLVYSYGSTKKASVEADFTIVEGPVGLEPTTPCLKGRCSNRLSYGPIL
jgi:DNA invertase Pin-like site-specific DNA recombinase